MTPETFVFIGRSGCGKGTQAELLIEKLRESKRPVFHLETGAMFRDFIAGDSYSNQLAKTIMDRGERQPDFLAVWMWSHLLVENLKGGEILIFDGTPRSLNEAKMLETALDFYNITDRFIVYLNISRAEAAKRLALRGRGDDQNLVEVTKRLDWFDADVLPAVEYYREAALPDRFVEINGEQTVPAIHTELLAKTGLA